MCIRYQPLLKNTTPFSCQPSPLNQQTVQAPFLGNPPSKSLFFQWTPKILKFLSLIPSYLLKVTKFLGNISQFEFLVMTEKNNFAYKLFLLLNISDFNLFFMWQLHPPPPHEKSHPLFPCNLPLKVEVLSIPTLFENLVGGSTPPLCRKGGAHYELVVTILPALPTYLT